ncbi:DUF302 domain-containing protein [Pelistega ratti]|uniref:DUF302 domain-containing protein n=1 Tax=Pelistega ratti TaxID=2652177 RepID=UPI00135B9738|nr:DUF302 domain-containing protein [Pelistega ratti]
MKNLLVATLLLASTPFVYANPSLHQQAHEHPMNQTVTLDSKYSFDETVNKLTHAVESKGMTVFAVIDHQAAAAKDGLTMQPAKVIIFGTPKAGTPFIPFMVKDPIFALQLPLKVLVTEVDGKVKVAHTSTQALIASSTIQYNEVENNLANAEKLIKKIVTE